MMQRRFLANAGVLLAILSLFVSNSRAFGAAAGDPVAKEKKEGESKGYIFAASHDEIVAKAKKEGRLRAVTGLSTSAIRPMVEAFKKKYPFLDAHVEEIEGTEAYERFLLELKAGAAK